MTIPVDSIAIPTLPKIEIPENKIKMLSSMIKQMKKKPNPVSGPTVKDILAKFDNKIAIFDTETTGLGQFDRIVEISCLDFSIETLSVTKQYCTRFNPQRSIPEEASKIHGIYYHDVKDKPYFSSAQYKLFRYLSTRLVIAHNLKFDLRMLLNEAKRCRVEMPDIYGLCTNSFARIQFPGAKMKLQSLHNNLIGEHEQVHSALDDSMMLARLVTFFFQNFRENIENFPVEPSWFLPKKEIPLEIPKSNLIGM